MCFIHVLLNALDLYDKGLEGLIVIEGEAVKLVPEMSHPGHFLFALYQKANRLGLIREVCLACSKKLGVAEAVEKVGLPLTGDISGHPSMSRYLQQGYRVITL
ncbi:MAG: DsrE family protein [Candidatus Marinimicrobia bacterium]|nr:DsrE family protein [Candidatus Neomarinimicrobiota bacterium]